MDYTNHKEFFKTKEMRKCCPTCSKMIIAHFRTNKQKKMFNKKGGWPDAWTFDYEFDNNIHRFLFFDEPEKQHWIQANIVFKSNSIFTGDGDLVYLGDNEVD